MNKHGRPKLPDYERKSTRLHVRVSEDTVEMLDELSFYLCKNKSEVIRDLIKEKLEEVKDE